MSAIQTSTQQAVTSDTFDLTNWKLTLPVDSTNQVSGTAAEVTNLTSFTSPYFQHASDGGMVFIAPVIGATTANSHYARSELREMNGSKPVAWTAQQGGTMQTQIAVESVPLKSDGTPGRVVIGQVHGQNAELTRLYYDRGKICFVDDHGGKNNGQVTLALHDVSGRSANIALGEKFNYDIHVGSGRLTVEVVANGVQYSATEAIKPIWNSDKFYFKAGVYDGVGAPGSGAGSLGTGTGSTEIYQLAVSHI